MTDVNREQISDLITDWTAVLELCQGILQELAEYYTETKQHYSHPEMLEYNPPSKEEINMVRERWVGLSKSLSSMKRVLNRAHRHLKKAPDARRFTEAPPSWRESPKHLDPEEESEEESEEEPSVEHLEHDKTASMKSTSSSSGRTRGFLSGLKSRFFSGRNAS
jgi:hypothetical protein